MRYLTVSNGDMTRRQQGRCSTSKPSPNICGGSCLSCFVHFPAELIALVSPLHPESLTSFHGRNHAVRHKTETFRMHRIVDQFAFHKPLISCSRTDLLTGGISRSPRSSHALRCVSRQVELQRDKLAKQSSGAKMSGQSEMSENTIVRRMNFLACHTQTKALPAHGSKPPQTDTCKFSAQLVLFHICSTSSYSKQDNTQETIARAR